jgi:hypothetical protein
MESKIKKAFKEKWQKYFNNSELPICFYYTDKVSDEELKETETSDRCLIANLNRVREGFTYVYSVKTWGCAGGKRYCGFTNNLRPNFKYFLSYGIPGKMEGERYKKTPELVEAYIKNRPTFKAPAKYLVFKRWDKLGKSDEPLAVIFYATPDVLSCLFTLANYDCDEPHGVIAPMGAGCGSIIGYPIEEAKSDKPRCVLGMLDISARPFIPDGLLTFTIPYKRFLQMLANMGESFLITHSWEKIRKRIK